MSVPALSWDFRLNITKVGLELISDAGMYLFFEEGIRGGVSYIYNRYGEANNKFLNYYDPKQKSKHNIYLDANS